MHRSSLVLVAISLFLGVLASSGVSQEKTPPTDSGVPTKDKGRLTKEPSAFEAPPAKATTEKTASDKATAEKPATEKPTTEKANSEKANSEKATSEKTTTESTEKPVAPAKLEPKPRSTPKARDPNETARFSFDNADWERVIRQFAEDWGLALHQTSWPAGKLQYTDPRPLDRKQQMDVINSILLTKGFVLARRDKMLLLHNLKDGPVPDAWVPLARRDELDQLGEFELRKMIFPVDRIDFDVVTQEVRNVVERPSAPSGATTTADGGVEVKIPGRLIPLPASRQLFVVETGGNLRNIDQLVRGLAGDGVKSFKLEHITLDEAVVIVKPLLGVPADLWQTPDGSVKLAPVAATSTLLVTGKPDMIKQVDSILKMVDKEQPKLPGVEPTRPELRIYPIAGDSQTIFQVLQTMLAGSSVVRLTRDPSNGNIVALCLPDQHRTIQETIEKLEGKGLKKFRTWTLASAADAAMVLATINETLGGGGSASAPSTGTGSDAKQKVAPVMSGAPKILINTNNRSMLAFGTENQLKQIDDLLGVMKWSEAAAKEDAGIKRSTVRVLPFHRDAVDLVRLHFPSMRRNPIEVVVPSRSGTSGGLESIDSLRPKSFMHRSPLRGPEPSGKGDAGKGETPEPKKAAARDGSAPRTTWQSQRQTRASFVAHRLDGEDAPHEQAIARADVTVPGAAMQPKLNRFVRSAFIDPERAPDPEAVPAKKPSEAKKLVVGEPAKSDTTKSNAAKPSVKPGQLPGSTDKPVKMTVTEKGIILTSEDPDALDAIEELLSLLPPDPVASGKFKIYYLKHISASLAKAELDQILTGDTTETGGTSTSGNLVGDVARGMLGGLGGSMVEGLLSSGSSGGVGSLVGGTPLIVPDDRLNALIVQAGPNEQSLIEQLLVFIDAEEAPETKVARKPGLIPVFYNSADDIAAIVKDLYQDRMLGGAARGGAAQQPSPREFLDALRGGGGRNQRNQRRQEEADKMTVGIDKRSNSLIVVAPKTLFDEVDQLVAVLDQAAEEPTNEVRKVLKMKAVSPDILAKALKAIGGDKVHTTTTSGVASTPTRPTISGAPGTTPGAPGAGPFGSGDAERFLQLQEMLRGGGGRGPRGGGDGPRGGGAGGETIRAFPFPGGGGR